MSLRQFTFCPAWSSQEIRVLRRRELFGFWNKKQCSAPLNFFILAEPCWVPIVYWVCQRMYNDHCVRKKKKRCSSRLSFFLRFPVLTWNVLSCVLQLCKCMVCAWCHTINYDYKGLSCDSNVSCISTSDQQICLFFLHCGAVNCCYLLTVTCRYLK